MDLRLIEPVIPSKALFFRNSGRKTMSTFPPCPLRLQDVSPVAMPAEFRRHIAAKRGDLQPVAARVGNHPLDGLPGQAAPAPARRDPRLVDKDMTRAAVDISEFRRRPVVEFQHVA